MVIRVCRLSALMNDVDLAWLAGIFEGEGSASMNIGGRGKIQFDNTDRTMLEAVAAAIGYGMERIHGYSYSASTISLSAKKGYSSRGTIFRVYVLDFEIVKRIYPFVRSKEKKAKLEICFPDLLK